VLVNAHGQGLSVIFKGVRRRLSAFIDHRKRFAVFHQNKLCAGAAGLDRTRLYVASNAQIARISFVAHGVQFFDRHVITLALLDASVGKISKSQHNKRDRNPEPHKFFGFQRHTSFKVIPALQAGQEDFLRCVTLVTRRFYAGYNKELPILKGKLMSTLQSTAPTETSQQIKPREEWITRRREHAARTSDENVSQMHFARKGLITD